MCVLYRLGKGERREEGRWGYGEGEIKEGRCGKRTRGDEKNEKKGTDRGVRKREGEWGRRGERRERWGGERDIMKRGERYMDIGGETERKRGECWEEGLPYPSWYPRDTVCMYTCLSRVVFSCPRVVTARESNKTCDCCDNERRKCFKRYSKLK